MIQVSCIITLVININPDSFWFYISAAYFPSALSSEVKKSLTEGVEKVLDHLTTSSSLFYKRQSEEGKKLLLADFSSLSSEEENNSELIETGVDNLVQNFEINNLIHKLEKQVKEVSRVNRNKFGGIDINPSERNIISTTYDPNDLFTDNPNSQILNTFTEYLKKRHIEMVENIINTGEYFNEGGADKSDYEDKCSVCNLFDYNDHASMITCFTCNTSLHYQCYGLIDKPGEKWYCDLCKLFHSDSMGKVDCILCPNKGGVFKRCNLKMNSSKYRQIMNLRSSSDSSEMIGTGNNSNMVIEITNDYITDSFNSDNNISVRGKRTKGSAVFNVSAVGIKKEAVDVQGNRISFNI
jgi:hypothetical protein